MEATQLYSGRKKQNINFENCSDIKAKLTVLVVLQHHNQKH